MDIDILYYNKLGIGMKIYIQDAINVLMRMCPQNYYLQKIKIYTKLIQTRLHYQIRQNILFHCFKAFMET